MITDIISTFKSKDFYSDLTELSYIASNIKQEKQFVYLLAKNMQIKSGTRKPSLGSYLFEKKNGKKYDLVEVNGSRKIINAMEVKYHLEFDSIQIAIDIKTGKGTIHGPFTKFTDFVHEWVEQRYKPIPPNNFPVAPSIIRDLSYDPTIFMWVVHHRPMSHSKQVCFQKKRDNFGKKKFKTTGMPSLAKYQGCIVHTSNKQFLKITDLFALHSSWSYGYCVFRVDIATTFSLIAPPYKSDYHIYLFIKKTDKKIKSCNDIIENFNTDKENGDEVKITKITEDLWIDTVEDLWGYE